ILGLFFLPGKLGTAPGEFITIKADRKGDKPDQAIGKLPDNVEVVIDGVEADWDKIGNDDKKKPVVTAEITGVSDVNGPEGGRVLTAKAAPIAPFLLFFGLMLLHSIFYVPTISITNSIAFANLRDPAQEFGPVRVWGTIGWIAASWPFIFILVNWAAVP